MFTAIISTLIVAVLAMFGVKLSLAQIAGVAIVVKVLIVGGILGVTAKYFNNTKEPPPGSDPTANG